MIAFEAVARLRGFGKAATELNTSQSAISRHIKNLEIRLGAPLFNRDGLTVTLTRKGDKFYVGVSQALDVLRNSVSDVSPGVNEVTVACTHEVSHLILMPNYAQLRHHLGRRAELRIVTTEYDLVSAAVDTGADIVFEYSKMPPGREHVVVCAEEIKVIGSPKVVAQASTTLKQNNMKPNLLGLRKANYGWLDWDSIQSAHPQFAGWAVTESFDNYVYLLEAAAQGRGLALGWRGFVNRYLASGTLVEFPGDWYGAGTKLFARLTRFGEQSSTARKFLKCLENLNVQDGASPP